MSEKSDRQYLRDLRKKDQYYFRALCAEEQKAIQREITNHKEMDRIATMLTDHVNCKINLKSDVLYHYVSELIPDKIRALKGVQELKDIRKRVMETRIHI